MEESKAWDLVLPQLSARLTRPAAEVVVLVAGGRPPAADWLKEAAAGRRVWCADRGAAACRRADVVPHRLLGDLDSAEPEDWNWAGAAGARTTRFPSEKDLTDTQLALEDIKSCQPSAFVLLTGGLGGRLDHLFSALFSLAWSGLSGCLADEKEVLFCLEGPAVVELRPVTPPLALSLLPLTPAAEGVTLTGVHWPLEAARLSQSEPYAVSNRLQDGPCRLSLKKGRLGLYLCWRETGL